MRLKIILLGMLAVFALAGCRSAPIYEVVNAPVDIVPGKQYSLTNVRDAIIRAGTSLGWQMKPAEPGHIVGTLNIRDHMAQVDINYNRSSYDIRYKDSSNLDYNGTNIHPNYNGWIQRLDNTIRSQLANL